MPNPALHDEKTLIGFLEFRIAFPVAAAEFAAPPDVEVAEAMAASIEVGASWESSCCCWICDSRSDWYEMVPLRTGEEANPGGGSEPKETPSLCVHIHCPGMPCCSAMFEYQKQLKEEVWQCWRETPRDALLLFGTALFVPDFVFVAAAPDGCLLLELLIPEEGH